jgi:hypothetical protein
MNSIGYKIYTKGERERNRRKLQPTIPSQQKAKNAAKENKDKQDRTAKTGPNNFAYKISVVSPTHIRGTAQLTTYARSTAMTTP